MTTTQIYNGLLEQKQIKGTLKFWKFIDDVYASLKCMNPGESIDIEKDVDPDDNKFYILACCLFFIEISSDYIFTNDYKTLKRNELDKTPKTSAALARVRANDRRNSTGA